MQNTCYVEGSGDGSFLVGDRGIDDILDMHKRTCTCRRIQKAGIPCSHVVACCRDDRIDHLQMVDPCYSKQMLNKTYGNIIYPCKDKTEWEDICGPPIDPPLYKKHVGRPSTTRRQAPREVDHRRGGKKIPRHGVIIHCSYCAEPHNNKNGCKYLKAGLLLPNAGAGGNVPPRGHASVDGATNVPPPNHPTVDGAANVPSSNQQTTPSGEDVDLVLTQELQQPSVVYEDLMVDNMIARVIHLYHA